MSFLQEFPSSSSGPVVVTGIPAAVQDNWAVSGLTADSILLVQPVGVSFISGIVPSSAGQRLTIVNNTSDGIIWLTANDTLSSTANRLRSFQDVILLPGDTLTIFATASSGWIPVSQSPSWQSDFRDGLILPGNTGSLTTSGATSSTLTGTPNTLAPIPNSTDYILSKEGRRFSATTANSSSGYRDPITRLAIGTGNRHGFYCYSEFVIEALGASGSAGVGLVNNGGSFTSAIQIQSNSIGFEMVGGDTTIKAFSRAAVLDSIDLAIGGIGVPLATFVYTGANGSVARFMARSSGSQRASASSTSLPGSNVTLSHRAQVNVGAVAATTTMTLYRVQAGTVSS